MLQKQIEGKYEILGQLEDDEAGEVYKVRHLFLDEVRLIRVVRPQVAMTEEATAAYLQEARTAIRLRHPNIAQLHDFTVGEEGDAYIFTELVEGLTLEEALREAGPPPVDLALEVAQQAARGLGSLHRGGTVHGEIAPDKLVLTRDVDGQPLVKWVDVGISRVLAAEEETTYSGGGFPGKPRYASPEQFSATGAVDARSDLYSLGVVLYELLTGRCPVAGHDPFSYMAGHLSKPPLDFTESDPEGRLPVAVREILLQALAKKPEDRMASADELARRLGGAQMPASPAAGEYLGRILKQARERSATAWRPVPAPPPPAPTVPAAAPVPVPKQAPSLEEMPTVAVPAAAAVKADRAWSERELDAPKPLERQETPARAVEPEPPVVQAIPAPQVPVAGTPDGEARKKTVLVAAAVLLIALVGGGIWWSQRSGPADAVETAASPEPSVGLPPAPPPVEEVIEEESPPAPDLPVKPEVKPERPRIEEVRPEPTPAQRAEKPKPPVETPAPPPVAEALPASSPAPEPSGAPFQRGDMITGGGPGIEGVEAVSLPEPIYPQAARQTGKRLNVRVAILVDENGNPTQVRIKEGDPSGLGFNEAAREAAMRARFLPATRNGVPGKMWTELLYEFVPGAPPPASPPP